MSSKRLNSTLKPLLEVLVKEIRMRFPLPMSAWIGGLFFQEEERYCVGGAFLLFEKVRTVKTDSCFPPQELLAQELCKYVSGLHTVRCRRHLAYAYRITAANDAGEFEQA